MNSPIWNQYTRLIVIAAIVAFFTGCGEEAPESSSTSSSLGNPTVGVVQEDSFYVRLYDEAKFSYYMSKMGDFKTPCSIANGKTGQVLDCVLDMNELDIYYHGMSLQYNVPSTMCNYVKFSTYWYYNYEVGTGPTTITSTQTKDKEGNVLSSSCTMDGDPGCGGLEASYDAVNDQATCVYDHSSTGGPNCCFGNYTKTVSITTDTGSPVVTTTKGTWGGDFQACIGGAAKTNWDLFTKSGYPAAALYFTPEKGLNQKYDVTAPIKSFNSGANFTIANFYTPSKHSHSSYNTSPSTSSSLPYIVAPLDDRSGDAIGSGSPAYTWSCLDKNDEVINQIRLYVREWNTYKEFVKYGTTQGASGDPDVAGEEGTDCDYYSSDVCNDYVDLDDNTAATYDASTKPGLYPEEKL